ncbi:MULTISPECIES: hypothetical protein [unclassified Bradyrhizobium]|uniref:hypothetical protein n=1 Tax=unclassified Bradyrhizobium TaxID=2631580 RepID=UPI0024E0A899|nr:MULTISPECIES: hypothetical protein [unclassified Bradyrhizobium]
MLESHFDVPANQQRKPISATRRRMRPIHHDIVTPSIRAHRGARCRNRTECGDKPPA